MAPPPSPKEDPVTEEELQDVERRLISLPSSVVEHLHLLDEVENVLKKVEQSSLIEALNPIVKALVSDSLLKNDDRDVRISVASCISQIMRITAPDSPYGDEDMKVYFQQSVSAFEKLSSLSGRQYTKSVSILETFAKFRTCILMLDLELNKLIVKMFKQLFDYVGSNLPPDVSLYVERTMTMVIEESEELPEELITLLLNTVKMENRKVQPLAWELGENVLKNCVTTLKKYIPEAVALMRIDLGDFAEIVTSICQAASGKQNLEVKELAPEAIEHGKASGSQSGTKNNAAPNGNEDASKAKKSLKTPKPFRRSKQQRHSEKIDTSKENEEKEDGKPIAAMNGDNSRIKKSEKGESSTKTSKKRKSHSEIIDTARGINTELDTEVTPKKRYRKPNSLIQPDEGYFHSSGDKYLEISQLKRNSKKKGGNPPKTSALKDNSVQRSKKKTRNLSEEMSPMEKCVRKEKSVTNEDGKMDSLHVSEDHEKVTDSISKTKRTKQGSRQHGEASKVKRKSLSTELKEEAPKKTNVVKNRGEKLVGHKIQVWWPEDNVFYPGKITSFDRAANKYQVLYHDGDVEMLDLKKERWELLKDGEEIMCGSNAPINMVIPECEKIKAAIENADFVEVKGFKVKASIAPTLEDIFSKYGDIVSQCPYKSASVKASILEIVCDTVQRLHNNNSAPNFNEVESVINDAEEAKLDIGWLRVELEKRRVAEEAGQKGAMLRETKRGIVRAAKAAKFDLEHRKAELAAAQKKVEDAERCFEVLKCVKRKLEADILENEALGKKRSKLL